MSQPPLNLIDQILRDPVAAHHYFFEHRHTDISPDYFEEVLLDIWDFTNPKLLEMIFRGGAKSTILEEAAILFGCLGLIKYCVIVGASEPMGADRLTAIKHEFESNERLIDVFGNLPGQVWGYTRALLKNNVLYQAKGVSQSFRGAKHLDQRPDMLLLDDIETDESMGKEGEGGDKVLNWIMTVAMPAMDRKRQIIRMAATPVHPNAACVQLSKDPSWTTHKIPVYHYPPDSTTPVSAWEDRFPLKDMLTMKEEYERLGRAREFAQEYLCDAEHAKTKAFDVTTLPVNSDLHHSFEPTVLIVDPARTVKTTSSLTGYVVASFANARMTVWEAFGNLDRPSDIIENIFRLHALHNLTFIGVERDGLEEFVLQPLRQEMLRRNTFLPLIPLKAPKNKHEFIRSLQPFITGGDIVLAKPCPQLQAQLQNFPAGKNDTLNALAYVPRMFPGQPVYQGFDPALQTAILDELGHTRANTPALYAVAATSTEAAAVAVSQTRQATIILAGVVIEGAPGTAVPEALAHVRTLVARPGGVVIPRALHTYDTIGVAAVLRSQGETPSTGADPARARAQLQSLIDARKLQVAEQASWVLRALTGGYTYDTDAKTPKQNAYRTLMEAVEAVVPIFSNQAQGLEGHRAVDPRSGKTFLTSRPDRHTHG